MMQPEHWNSRCLLAALILIYNLSACAQAFELLRSGRQRSDYLLTKQVKSMLFGIRCRCQ